MYVAGQRELLGAGPSARLGLRFHHEHAPSGARERDRRDEAVGSRADDDRVVLDRSGQWSCSSGMLPPMRVPEPGELSTVSVPPTAPRRSRMFTNPWPAPATDGVEARARVRNAEVQVLVVARDRHRDRGPFTGVLACVLHRLQAAEVDRGLGLAAGSGRPPRRSTSVGSTARFAAVRSASASPRSRSSGG